MFLKAEMASVPDTFVLRYIDDDSSKGYYDLSNTPIDIAELRELKGTLVPDTYVVTKRAVGRSRIGNWLLQAGLAEGTIYQLDDEESVTIPVEVSLSYHGDEPFELLIDKELPFELAVTGLSGGELLRLESSDKKGNRIELAPGAELKADYNVKISEFRGNLLFSVKTKALGDQIDQIETPAILVVLK